MKSRTAVLALTAAMTTTIVACTDGAATGPNGAPAVARSSAASGGGGGGGGAARPCAILSFALQNDIVNKLVVPSLWLPNTYCQAIAAGTAE